MIRQFALVYGLAVAIVVGIDILYNIHAGQPFLTIEMLVLLVSVPLVLILDDITKLRLSKDGIEIEKTKTITARTVEKIASGRLANEQEIEVLFKSLETNDWAKIVLARMLMRQILVRLFPDHNIPNLPGLADLLKVAGRSGRFEPDFLRDLDRLRSISFYAEWWQAEKDAPRPPSREEWNWAATHAQNLVIRLYGKQQVGE